MEILLQQHWKSHLLAVLLMLIGTSIYFYPALQGKVLDQHDISQSKGWHAEIKEFQEKENRDIRWTNTMFSGMPTAQIQPRDSKNLFVHLHRTLDLGILGMHNPLGTFFLLALGMYFLLAVLRIPPLFSALASLVFSLSTINTVLLSAGHMSKLYAVAYLGFFLAGLILLFVHRNYKLGVIATAIGFALQILSNHFQITLYLLIIVLIFGVFQLILSAKSKDWTHFTKALGCAVIAVILGILPNTSALWSSQSFAEESIRGKAIIDKADVDRKAGDSGLDKKYAFDEYSYGWLEMFNFIIPNFMGGASVMELDESSAAYNEIKNLNRQQAKSFIKQVPTYWGNQSFVAGPFYMGIVIFVLAFLGLFYSSSKLKWWLLASAIFLAFIALGKNFSALNYALFDYFPMFNKFRAFTSSLSAVHLCVVALAGLGIKAMWDMKAEELANRKTWLYVGGGFAGLCGIFALFGGGLFRFEGPVDVQLAQYGAILDAIHIDRATLLKKDALRSLVLVVMLMGFLYLWVKNKLSKTWVLTVILLLAVIDVWTVSKRFQNADDFITERKYEKKFKPSDIDKQILNDKDVNYRVMNLATSTFNDSYTALHHKTVGGYHPAKLRRYQDMIEGYIGKNHSDVLNMLNTKYLIAQTEDGTQIIQNPEALGNAWFVNQIHWAKSNQAEYDLVEENNPKTIAIVHESFQSIVGNESQFTGSGTILLTKYAPDHLFYESNSSANQLAVFSEVWYPQEKGWSITIDGQPTSMIRTNYILRGLMIPSGKHTIEFQYLPKAYTAGSTISLFSSILLLLLTIFVFYTQYKGVPAPKAE